VVLVVIGGMAVLAGGCSHKDPQARANGGKIPLDRSVTTGLAAAHGRSGHARHPVASSFTPAAAPVSTALPDYATWSPTPYSAGTAYSPATAAPQFQPVDPTDFAAPRPAYAAAAAPPTSYRRQGPASRRGIAPARTETPQSTRSFRTWGGTQYHVQQGDTLFGIARSRYGDGKRWQEIASANPGLTPDTLRAGSTIVVP
jgi:nucleoid-associated protein YgaU